jgi:hypothetical protein
MKRVHFLVLFGLVLTSQGLPAQTPKPAPKPSGRYLLIVETSTSMRRRAGAVQDAARSMLRSGLNGQLRPGDTLGLWTFNEELYAGRFPLRLWTPESREEIAQAIVEFLKKQRYEKQARVESIFPELQQVINSSETITVLLISTGESEMKGTPFDQQINATYAQWRREMQRMQTPFITVLRARNGQMASHVVSMAPWPVEFPPFLPEPKTIAATPPLSAIPARRAEPLQAPKRVAPIILDMSKPPAEPAKEAAQPEAAKAGQGLPPLTPASETTALKVDRTETSAASTISTVPVTEPKVEPPPVAPPPKPAAAPSPVAAPTANAMAKAEPRQPLEQKATKVETEPAMVQPAEAVATPLEKPAPPSPPPKAPEPAAPPAPEVQPTATPTAAPEPDNVPADSGASVRSPTATSAPPPLAPGQAAVTTPAGAVSSTKKLFISAAVLLAVVAGLFILLLRRARSAPRASLITRSMERKEP